MLDREKLSRVTRIVSHADCADGLASAMVLRDAYLMRGAPVPPIVFCRHGGEELELPVVAGTLFCDFSPPRERMQEHLLAGGMVLDHHRSTKDIVLAFGEDGVFGDERANPGVSGTVLAFEHAWKPMVEGIPSCCPTSTRRALVERFARLSGVRDTWQRRDPEWRDACALAETLSFFPPERWMQRDLGAVLDGWHPELSELGNVLLERNERFVRRTIEGGHRFVSVRGTKVICFNATRPVSDAAEKLESEVDLVMGYAFQSQEGFPMVRFALRSRGTFDCARFAESHGGGGHTNAAGFRLRIHPSHPEPFGLVERLVAEHER